MDGDREDLRRRFAARITRLLLSDEFRSVLCQVEGRSNIIVALPDDRMGDVFDRLAGYKSCATIVSPWRGGFAVASCTPSLPADVKRAEDDSPCPIHEDTHVEMFLEYLRRVRRPVLCHLAEPACAVELVDEDDGQPVALG